MSHKCRNPKFCPICRQKIKREIVEFFDKNMNTIITYNILLKKFPMPYDTLWGILRKIEKERHIEKKHIMTKNRSVGRGAKVYFISHQKNYRDFEVNSKAWIKIF